MDAEAVIAQYKAALREGSSLKRLIVVGLVVVIAINLMIVRGRFHDFLNNESGEFAAALGNELANIDPALSQQAADMFNRLVPLYGNALVTAYDRHRPAVVAETQKELDALDAYAQERWPEIERQLVGITLDQERLVSTRLAEILPAEQAQEISRLYGEALLNKITALLDGELKPHRVTAEQIGENLSKMLAATPAPEDPVESRVIVGLTLELAGLGMQDPLFVEGSL